MQGNVHAVCFAVKDPEYRESVGERGCEMTKVVAMCKEMTPDGMQTVSLDLIFYDSLAIPAYKIGVGNWIVIDGRESSKEYFSRQKYKLERTVIVEYWNFRIIDPGGMAEELKVRHEIAAKDREYRELLAEYMTELKPSILQWFTDWIRENIGNLMDWMREHKANAQKQQKGKEEKGGDDQHAV